MNFNDFSVADSGLLYFVAIYCNLLFNVISLCVLFVCRNDISILDYPFIYLWWAIRATCEEHVFIDVLSEC